MIIEYKIIIFLVAIICVALTVAIIFYVEYCHASRLSALYHDSNERYETEVTELQHRWHLLAKQQAKRIAELKDENARIKAQFPTISTLLGGNQGIRLELAFEENNTARLSAFNADECIGSIFFEHITANKE